MYMYMPIGKIIDLIEKKKLKQKMYMLVVFLLAVSVLLASFVIGQPPLPHNIQGNLFANG
jgi:hypothetical protein